MLRTIIAIVLALVLAYTIVIVAIWLFSRGFSGVASLWLAFVSGVCMVLLIGLYKGD